MHTIYRYTIHVYVHRTTVIVYKQKTIEYIGIRYMGLHMLHFANRVRQIYSCTQQAQIYTIIIRESRVYKSMYLIFDTPLKSMQLYRQVHQRNQVKFRAFIALVIFTQFLVTCMRAWEKHTNQSKFLTPLVISIRQGIAPTTAE